MKIVAVSDLHGHLPDIPECDLVLLAGDICPDDEEMLYGFRREPLKQSNWLATDFADWSRDLPPIVMVAGNHDFVFEHKHLVPPLPNNITYLQQKVAELRVAGQDLNIYGSPYTHRFYEWAFMLDEEDLDKRFKRQIPEDADIWVTHQPPYGFGDRSSYGDVHVGNQVLYDLILKYGPKLNVFGHIHSGHGQWLKGETVIANVSLVDEKYRPVYGVTEIEL